MSHHRQKYSQKKRSKHYHGCRKCNQRYVCTALTTCVDDDDSIFDECAICEVRSPAFKKALKALHEQIKKEMEPDRIYILQVFDKHANDEHVVDHVFRKKQQAINYFEVHYNALRYGYSIDHTEMRF